MEPTNEIADLLRQLPVGVHVTAMIGLMLGLVVCFAGGKLVRPLVSLIAGAIGAFVGFTIVAVLPEGFDPVIVMGVGAAIGVIVGFAMFRFYMAFGLAVLFGFGGLFGVFAYGSITGAWADEPVPPLTEEQMLIDDVPVRSSPDESGSTSGSMETWGAPVSTPVEAPDSPPTDGGDGPTESGATTHAEGTSGTGGARSEVLGLAAESLAHGMDVDPAAAGDAIRTAGAAAEKAGDIMDTMKEQAAPIAEPVRKVVRALFREWRARWADLPAIERRYASLAAVLGGLLGLVIGLFLPDSASTLVTGAAGSALSLACVGWLAARFQVPLLQQLPTHATATPIAWAALWIGGVMFQWTILRRKPDD
jgi:hypothetical protein